MHRLPAGNSKVQLEAVRQFVYGDDAEPPKAGSAANSATSSPTTSTAPLAAAPVAAAHPTPVSQPETASAVPASVRPVPRTQSTGDSDSFYDAPAASPHTVEIAKEQDPIETTTAAP